MTKDERNEWLINNMAFVLTIIKRFKRLSNYEDIAQTACYAALVALDRCEPGVDERQMRQYVAKYINGYVIKFCINNNCLVFIPHHERGKVDITVHSTDYEYSNDDGSITSFEELYLPEEELGYEEVETKIDFERILGTLKENKRKVVVLMAENESRKITAEIMGYARSERIRQILNEVRPEFME